MAAPITSLDLDRHLTAAGAPAATFAALWNSLWDQPYLSAQLLEMCRLTLARLHRDAAELGAHNPHVPPGSLPPERRAALLAGVAARSALFSAAEQAVLDFTESYALDAQSLSDAQADAVKQQLGEPGLVFLIEALGCLDGRIRAARCLRDLALHAPAGGADG
jgi:hypothetical protein